MEHRILEEGGQSRSSFPSHENHPSQPLICSEHAWGERWRLFLSVFLFWLWSSKKKKLSPWLDLTLPTVFRNHQAVKTLLSLEPRFPCCHLLSCLSWLCVPRLGAVQGNKAFSCDPAVAMSASSSLATK